MDSLQNSIEVIFLLAVYSFANNICRMNPIRYIRTQVFKVNQAEFASIAGVRQGSVSRWENGVSPSLEEMHNIREGAKARGIAWNDSWFFDVPTAVAQ